MLRPTANAVKAKENYLLEVTFDNGEVKTFDVKPYIKGSWYGQLKDVSYFSEVSTDGYTVVWPDGQDLCPDELYALSEEKLYLIADETTAPYEDGNNPFVRTEKDEEFDLKVAEKFGLVMENA